MSVNVDFASGIAEEMRSNHVPRTWRKVTTVLSAYGRYKLTQDARTQIESDFDDAGLVCIPSMLTVHRAARVRLTLKEQADAAQGQVNAAKEQVSASKQQAGGVQSGVELDSSLPAGVTFWQNHEGRWLPVSSRSFGDNLLVIDIDLSVIVDNAVVLASLPGRFDGLDPETLKDLITPDIHAKFKKVSPGKRRASLFFVASDPDETVSSDKAIPLSLRLIEFALGRDWLVIARHPAQVYVSGSPMEGSRGAQTAGEYMASLEECGLDKAESSEDAALAIISQGLDSFTTTRAGLASYLESWRTEFASGSLDKEVLIDLQATLPLVVDALEPLLHPSVSAWVRATAAGQAVALRDQVQRNLDALHSLQGTTATAIAQADQAQNERYQRSLATLAAVFLAPALVASVFGANQLLEDSAQDLLWLLVAMVLTGAVTQIIISHLLQPRRPTRTRPASVAPKLPHPARRLRDRASLHAGSRRDRLPKSPPLTVPPVA